jgi:hypothetical protein
MTRRELLAGEGRSEQTPSPGSKWTVAGDGLKPAL